MESFQKLIVWLLSPQPAPWENPGDDNKVTLSSILALTGGTLFLPLIYEFVHGLETVHFKDSSTLPILWKLSPVVGLLLISIVLRLIGVKGVNPAVNILAWLTRALAATLLMMSFAASLMSYENVDVNRFYSTPLFVGLLCALIICTLLLFALFDGRTSALHIGLSAMLFLGVVSLILSLNLVGFDNPWYKYNPSPSNMSPP